MRLFASLVVAAVLQASGPPGSARPPVPLVPVPRCDGKPPQVVNQDATAHPYTLTCGRKVTERSIAPGETQVLEGFSGCVLALGSRTETLHTEMICTVRPGVVLACDLL